MTSLVLMIGWMLLCVPRAGATYRVGDPVGDETLRTVQGTPQRISKFRGKTVVKRT
jgi:hypothetical protein